MAFAKRINELGYNLRPGPEDPKRAERLAIACSTEVSDYDKMHALGVARIAEDVAKSGSDIFDKFFSDHSIDIQTGELLGRYIAEERDSGRRLRACYLAVEAEHEASDASSGKSKKRDKDVRRLEDKIDALCAAVEQLQSSVVPAATNGRPRPKAAAGGRAPPAGGLGDGEPACKPGSVPRGLAGLRFGDHPSVRPTWG